MAFRATAQPRRLTTLAAALTLALAATATSIAGAPVSSASPIPSPGPAAVGNDISWPQCPTSQGGYNLPGPQANASFVVIGLTDGGSFRANPCVGPQVTAAKTRHLWTSAYAISTYPTAAQLARYGGTGTLSTRLGRVGAAEASFNLATLTRVGLRPKMIWVDIEPRKLFPWSTSTVNNNAVINGVLARYRAAGMTVGIYSYISAWNSITGNRALPGVPTWFPVGRSGYAVAMKRCTVASFSGTKPWLVQWTDGVRDYDRTCPGVTGSAAVGNVLTPYLNVRLAVGSRGSAVTVLQRHLGGLVADGIFGPLTKAKVVSLQRARNLPADGVVTSAVWKALGAGAAYTPPVQGFMGTLFAST